MKLIDFFRVYRFLRRYCSVRHSLRRAREIVWDDSWGRTP
jgi:hypothetical protein